MKVIFTSNYQEMSTVSSKLVINHITSREKSNICVASGHSPQGMYNELIKDIDKFKSNQVFFTKLDEWHGISLEHESSCEKFLLDNLLIPLDIDKSKYISFESNPQNVDTELIRIRKELLKNPLTLSILGLGKNGHVGLNEPTCSMDIHTRLVELSETTKTHDMIENENIDFGLTIGLKDLFNSDEIILLVTGSNKGQYLESLFGGEITTTVPVTLMLLHPNLTVIVDEESFSKETLNRCKSIHGAI